MLSRFSTQSFMAARVLSRAVSAAAVLPSKLSPSPHCFHSTPTAFNLTCKCDSISIRFGSIRNGIAPASRRQYRMVRMKKLAAKRTSVEKELELSVQIAIEEQLPEDPEVMDISEMLRLNVPMAMKLAFENLNNSKYKTRDAAITDVGCFESVELSVLLCNDEFIRKLNKEWRDEDRPTDVLSMSQHIPELKIPVLMLGDIVVSVETAARQAEMRGHTLIDEIRILVVHGLLHLLGFDHELSDEAEEEMEKEEELLLNGLGWTGKGLIHGASDADTDGRPHVDDSNEYHVYELSKDRKRAGSLRFYKPKFRYIFCDMDGTLLNSKSQISLANAEALKEATSRGIKVVIATGKTRGAVINLMKMVNLTGKDVITSESTPGVFIQGLIVYGTQGREIYRSNLEPSICREALLYSLEHKVPIVAFSDDRCLSLFEHPLVDTLHTIYHEPKAEIIPLVEEFVTGNEIQKLIFLDTTEGVDTTLRPYWAKATGNRGSVVQAVSDILEIVPPGTSKGAGVKLLLQHLDVTPEEIMAIGDGENDVEMLQLASLGVALSNGSEKAKAVADVIGISNNEDGVADAIYRFAF